MANWFHKTRTDLHSWSTLFRLSLLACLLATFLADLSKSSFCLWLSNKHLLANLIATYRKSHWLLWTSDYSIGCYPKQLHWPEPTWQSSWESLSHRRDPPDSRSSAQDIPCRWPASRIRCQSLPRAQIDPRGYAHTQCWMQTLSHWLSQNSQWTRKTPSFWYPFSRLRLSTFHVFRSRMWSRSGPALNCLVGHVWCNLYRSSQLFCSPNNNKSLTESNYHRREKIRFARQSKKQIEV